jgi:predicted PurR-regulated permease PerM
MYKKLEAEMTRLMLILFSMISTTMMWVGMIAALTMGYDTLNPLLVAIAIGFVASVPATWFIAKQITG